MCVWLSYELLHVCGWCLYVFPMRIVCVCRICVYVVCMIVYVRVVVVKFAVCAWYVMCVYCCSNCEKAVV